MKDFAKSKEYSFEDAFEEDDDSSFDESMLSDINFSQITGKDFKKSFTNVKSKIKQVKAKVASKPKKPLTQKIPVRDKAFIDKDRCDIKKIGKVIVPRDRKVIVEGVKNFILNDECNDVKNINFHNGQRLKEIVFVFNNPNPSVNFNLQLFNPSMALDYLYSTSLNLNDQIQVAGGNNVSYTDVLFNLLANPLYIYNSKIIIAGPNADQQINIPLRFINKNTGGVQKIHPEQVGLKIDNFQKLRDTINFFCVDKFLNRPFIADGMDIIEYTVLAGNTVTLAFFCKQPLLKDRLFKKEINGNSLLI